MRAFVGIGYATLLPLSEIDHLAPKFTLRAKVYGDAVTPSAGFKVSVYEGVFQNNYAAVDVLVEGRLEHTSWTVKPTFPGAARDDPNVAATREAWDRMFGDLRTVSAGVFISFGARI